MRYFLVLLASILLCSNAMATLMWDEDVSGDLSNYLDSPTAMDAYAGSNILKGKVGPLAQDGKDVFILRLNGVLQLTNIFINFYDENDKDFTSFTLSPLEELCNCGAIDVYSQVRESDVGRDFASQFINSYRHDMSQYFTLWEGLSNPAYYELEFVFANVSEPNVFVLLCIVLLALMFLQLQRFGFGSIQSVARS